jgi:hypothetical protein
MPECRLIVLLEPVVLRATHSSIKCLHDIWFKMLRCAICRQEHIHTYADRCLGARSALACIVALHRRRRVLISRCFTRRLHKIFNRALVERLEPHKDCGLGCRGTVFNFRGPCVEAIR